MNPTLLRSVIEDPDSDAPRFAYADWAAQQPEEAHREHAVFIRGQIEIARAEPGAIPSGEYAWMRELHSRALARFGTEWSNGVAAFVDGYEFERGFVGLVKMSAKGFAENSAVVFDAAPIRHLDLTKGGDMDQRFFTLKTFSRLRSLAMDECGLHDSHIRWVIDAGQVAGLRWLSLKKNQLGLGAAEMMAESKLFSALQFANFSGNPVDVSEQLGYDAGVIVSAWLPPEGERLEKRFGPLSWLHKHEQNMNRYG